MYERLKSFREKVFISEINVFLSLMLITFWLTSFPLRGFLIPSVKLAEIFLFVHLLSYLGIYLFFNFLEKHLNLKIFSVLVFKVGVLTMLFPLVSEKFKFLIMIILGGVSSFIVIEIIKKLKGLKDKYWIYTGILMGNFVTLGLEKSSFSLKVGFLILGLSVFCIGVLMWYEKEKEKKEKAIILEEPLKEGKGRDLFYLLLAIGIFYLCGDLAYRWLEHKTSESNYRLILLISYGLGMLLGIIFRSKNWWGVRGLFILGVTVLFISKIFLHFKVFWVLLGAAIFLLFSVGLMDFLTLNYFITRFRIKILALLYAVISLSLFLGYFLFETLLLKKEEYVLSFLSVISLVTILLFYRVSFKEEKSLVEKEIEILDVQEKLTPQQLMEKINKTLPPYAKGLTRRESEVLFYYVIESKNLKEISEILGISRSSVKEYLKRVSMKLDTPIYELKNLVKELLEK